MRFYLILIQSQVRKSTETPKERCEWWNFFGEVLYWIEDLESYIPVSLFLLCPTDFAQITGSNLHQAAHFQ